MAAQDDYPSVKNISGPANSAAALSEHDTNEIAEVTRGVYVGGVGDLVVTMADGVDVTFTGVPAGTFLPIRIRKLKTATTATSVVGLW